MLSIFPSATEHTVNNDCLPLQFVLKNMKKSNSNTSLPIMTDIFHLLLNTNPDSAKKKDANGNGPIHVALKHEASLEVIQKLLECAPLITLESENKLFI